MIEELLTPRKLLPCVLQKKEARSSELQAEANIAGDEADLVVDSEMAEMGFAFSFGGSKKQI